MYVKSLRRFGAISIYLFLIFVYSPASFSGNEKGINDVRLLIEQIEAGDMYDIPPDELTNKIDHAKRVLDAHLDSHQMDVKALILTVRLGIIEALVNPTVISKGQQSRDSEELFSSLHLNIDRALKLQPNSAEANYWKARLYGIRPATINEADRLVKKPIDLNKAIQFSRIAVQLDPENIAYREALAIYLIDGLQSKEALEVMNANGNEHHPISVLLKDIDAFPLPAGTIFSKEDSASFGEMQMMRGRITDFPQLRVQVFVVPMDTPEIEEFYKQMWAGFKFLRQGNAGPFAQFMRYEESNLIPASNMSQLVEWAGNKNGLLLTLQEVQEATRQQRKETPAGHPLPPSLGENFGVMFYVNHRRIE